MVFARSRPFATEKARTGATAGSSKKGLELSGAIGGRLVRFNGNWKRRDDGVTQLEFGRRGGRHESDRSIYWRNRPYLAG